MDILFLIVIRDKIVCIISRDFPQHCYMGNLWATRTLRVEHLLYKEFLSHIVPICKSGVNVNTFSKSGQKENYISFVFL